MSPAEAVAAAIHEAFERTPLPGHGLLLGSRDGCEPAETIAPFRGFGHGRDVPVETLDSDYTALSAPTPRSLPRRVLRRGPERDVAFRRLVR